MLEYLQYLQVQWLELINVRIWILFLLPRAVIQHRSSACSEFDFYATYNHTTSKNLSTRAKHDPLTPQHAPTSVREAFKQYEAPLKIQQWNANDSVVISYVKKIIKAKDDRGIIVRIATFDNAVQILCPSSMRQKVLFLAHFTPISGHPGISKQYYTQRRTFYWQRWWRIFGDAFLNVTLVPQNAHNCVLTRRQCGFSPRRSCSKASQSIYEDPYYIG